MRSRSLLHFALFVALAWAVRHVLWRLSRGVGL